MPSIERVMEALATGDVDSVLGVERRDTRAAVDTTKLVTAVLTAARGCDLVSDAAARHVAAGGLEVWLAPRFPAVASERWVSVDVTGNMMLAASDPQDAADTLRLLTDRTYATLPSFQKGDALLDLAGDCGLFAIHATCRWPGAAVWSFETTRGRLGALCRNLLIYAPTARVRPMDAFRTVGLTRILDQERLKCASLVRLVAQGPWRLALREIIERCSERVECVLVECGPGAAEDASAMLRSAGYNARRQPVEGTPIELVFAAAHGSRRACGEPGPMPGWPPGDVLPIERHLRRHLDAPDVPLAIRVVDELPRDPNGAPDWERLQGCGRLLSANGHQSTARLVATIWRDVLELTALPGEHDDFFALGGHSLHGLEVLSRLREQCGIELPLDVLFSTELTVSSVATVIDAMSDGASA